MQRLNFLHLDYCTFFHSLQNFEATFRNHVLRFAFWWDVLSDWWKKLLWHAGDMLTTYNYCHQWAWLDALTRLLPAVWHCRSLHDKPSITTARLRSPTSVHLDWNRVLVYYYLTRLTPGHQRPLADQGHNKDLSLFIFVVWGILKTTSDGNYPPYWGEYRNYIINLFWKKLYMDMFILLFETNGVNSWTWLELFGLLPHVNLTNRS